MTNNVFSCIYAGKDDGIINMKKCKKKYKSLRAFTRKLSATLHTQSM